MEYIGRYMPCTHIDGLLLLVILWLAVGLEWSSWEKRDCSDENMAIAARNNELAKASKANQKLDQVGCSCVRQAGRSGPANKSINP